MSTFLGNIIAKGLGLKPAGHEVQSLSPRVRSFFEPTGIRPPAMEAATGMSNSPGLIEDADSLTIQGFRPSTTWSERAHAVDASEYSAAPGAPPEQMGITPRREISPVRPERSEVTPHRELSPVQPEQHEIAPRREPSRSQPERNELTPRRELSPGQNVQGQPTSQIDNEETRSFADLKHEALIPKGASPSVRQRAVRPQQEETDHTQLGEQGSAKPRPQVETQAEAHPGQAVRHKEERSLVRQPEVPPVSMLQPRPVDLPDRGKAEGVRSEVRSREEATPLPTINVTIGRVEVRASVQQSAKISTSPGSSTPRHSTLSLEEYLKQRGEGRR
jgi:hypothetical protein